MTRVSRLPSSARPGEGGVKLHRRNWGELVENVAGTSEYHWMAGNFLKYAGPLNWNDLPVDSHELVALCAPRPVFISAGATNGDGWVDAKGMFLAAAGAGPGLQAAGQEGSRDHRVSSDRDRSDRRRRGLPPAQRRTHAGAELADVPDVCRALLQVRTEGAMRTERLAGRRRPGRR